ncbi:hypothetical protein D3C81_1694880 [compost metagenome]
MHPKANDILIGVKTHNRCFDFRKFGILVARQVNPPSANLWRYLEQTQLVLLQRIGLDAVNLPDVLRIVRDHLKKNAVHAYREVQGRISQLQPRQRLVLT